MGIREGCTQGYWGQEQHFDSWGPTGYTTTTLFSSAFGRTLPDPNATLLDALNPQGSVSQLEQLAQQATAALLNAAHPDINYPLTTAQVISKFQAAFDSGNYEATKDLFDGYNNSFCPLN
jgi:hypothetical protein